ncbi:MAG: hypothetical protein M3Y59_24230 [Myxococcota bacterium]|nr:hypothetical protein [Myxococcota bacterium]
MRTQPRPVLTILLSESAERLFQALPLAVREQLQRIIQNIAELAAVAPPIDPVWLRLPHFRPPVLRFSYAGVEVFYEVDQETRVLRLTGLRHCGELEAPGR